MEFAQVLVVLWRRRGWVAFAALLALVIGLSTAYGISVIPPKLTAKSIAVGSASTEILVDSRRSALTDLSKDITVLETRAAVLAPFMTTQPVRQAIAAAVGIAPEDIYTSAPLNPDGTIFSNEPSAQQRSRQIIGQDRGYRLNFAANPNQPTITITAQAPTLQDAVRLADGAAKAFVNYINHIEQIQRIPALNGTVIRQLGPAEGGVIGGSVNAQLAVIAFLGSLIGFMVLIVIASSVVENVRQIRAAGSNRPDESPNLS